MLAERQAAVSKIKVTGKVSRGTLGGKPFTVTLWSWSCPRCGAWGCTPGWRGIYEEGRAHAQECREAPVQLIYAVRLPSYTWWTDPEAVYGIPLTSHEVNTEDPRLAVKYMDFPQNHPRDRQAAIVAHTSSGIRALDMTPAAAMKYREEWEHAEQS